MARTNKGISFFEEKPHTALQRVDGCEGSMQMKAPKLNANTCTVRYTTTLFLPSSGNPWVCFESLDPSLSSSSLSRMSWLLTAENKGVEVAASDEEEPLCARPKSNSWHQVQKITKIIFINIR